MSGNAHRAIAASLLLASFASPPAAATVYKCADERNQPVYQDLPCPAGRELRNFTTDPPSVSVIPMRPGPGATTRLVAPASTRPKGTSAAERREGTRAGDASQRRHVHLGMHEGEVMARIGKPDMKSGGNRKGARWTYMPAVGDPQTLTTVVFDDGRVVEVERKVVR